MTEPLCDSCGEWTDPATLQDGDCPGCVAVRPKPNCAYCGDTKEIEADNNGPIYPCPICTERPITPEYLRERGFAEPE